MNDLNHSKRLRKGYGQLMDEARASLTNNWGKAILAVVLFSILVGVCQQLMIGIIKLLPLPFVGNLEAYFYDLLTSLITPAGNPHQIQIQIENAVLGFVAYIPSALVSAPMTLGLFLFFLNLSRGKDPKPELIFDGFKQFLNAFVVVVLGGVLTTIGFMFFLLPGIIVALGLSQSLVILADNPTMNALEAMKRSWNLMRGNKRRLFILCFCFTGWAILAMLTCCIGFLWLYPYVYTTHMKFYDDLLRCEKETDTVYEIQ